MELRLVSSEGLPKRSVISMNTGPSRQTLVDKSSRVTWQSVGQAFELKVSPWPLQIDVYNRFAKSQTGAEIGNLDNHDCCKVALHSDIGTQFGIKFRVTQVKPDDRTSNRIYDESAAYFKKHHLKEFFQRILALLAAERPSDPYQVLAKYVHDAAESESLVDGQSLGTDHSRSGTGLNPGYAKPSCKGRKRDLGHHEIATKTGQSGKGLDTIFENSRNDRGIESNTGDTTLGNHEHALQNDSDDDSVIETKALPRSTDNVSTFTAEQQQRHIATHSDFKSHSLEPWDSPIPKTDRTTFDDIRDRYSNGLRPDDLFAKVASETEKMIAEMIADVGHRRRETAVSGNLADPPDLNLGADAMNHQMLANTNHRQFWLQQAHEFGQRSRGVGEVAHPQSVLPSIVSEHQSEETHLPMEEPVPSNTNEHVLQECPRLSRFIPACETAASHFVRDIVTPENPGLQEFIPHESAEPPKASHEGCFSTPRLSCFMPDA